MMQKGVSLNPAGRAKRPKRPLKAPPAIELMDELLCVLATYIYEATSPSDLQAISRALANIHAAKTTIQKHGRARVGNMSTKQLEKMAKKMAEPQIEAPLSDDRSQDDIRGISNESDSETD
jgi:hypothetical protein